MAISAERVAELDREMIERERKAAIHHAVWDKVHETSAKMEKAEKALLKAQENLKRCKAEFSAAMSKALELEN